MFGRKKSEQTEAPGPLAPENLVAPVLVPKESPPPSPTPLAAALATPASTPSSPSTTPSFPNRMPTMPPRPTAPEIARPSEAMRRPVEAVSAAPPPAVTHSRFEPEVRQLIVGREISLQGEIKTCDLLVVEGSVEANLSNCREVLISETGLFKGAAEVDDIEVRGRLRATSS